MFLSKTLYSLLSNDSKTPDTTENLLTGILFSINTNKQTKTQNYVKCLKYDDCAILHRFHILYISYDCDSKIELFMHFFLKMLSAHT